MAVRRAVLAEPRGRGRQRVAVTLPPVASRRRHRSIFQQVVGAGARGLRQAARTSPRTPRQACCPCSLRGTERCPSLLNPEETAEPQDDLILVGQSVSQSIRLNGGAKENPFPNNQSEASSFKRSSRTPLSPYQTNVLERSLLHLTLHSTSLIN